MEPWTIMSCFTCSVCKMFLFSAIADEIMEITGITYWQLISVEFRILLGKIKNSEFDFSFFFETKFKFEFDRI